MIGINMGRPREPGAAPWGARPAGRWSHTPVTWRHESPAPPAAWI